MCHEGIITFTMIIVITIHIHIMNTKSWWWQYIMTDRDDNNADGDWHLHGLAYSVRRGRSMYLFWWAEPTHLLILGKWQLNFLNWRLIINDILTYYVQRNFGKILVGNHNYILTPISAQIIACNILSKAKYGNPYRSYRRECHILILVKRRMGIFLLIYCWKSFANDTIMDIFGKTNEVSEGIHPVTEKLPSFFSIQHVANFWQ